MGNCTKCPLCSAELGYFLINEDEAITMCITAKCPYPFQEGGDFQLLPKSEAQTKIKQRSTQMRRLIQRCSTMKKGKRRLRKKVDSIVSLKDEKHNDDDPFKDFDIDVFLANGPCLPEENEVIELNDIINELELHENSFLARR